MEYTSKYTEKEWNRHQVQKYNVFMHNMGEKFFVLGKKQQEILNVVERAVVEKDGIITKKWCNNSTIITKRERRNNSRKDQLLHMYLKKLFLWDSRCNIFLNKKKLIRNLL